MTAMLPMRQVVISIFLILPSTIVKADKCALLPLPIEPIALGRTDLFIGESKLVTVQFRNDKIAGPVEVFPEPPLIIKNHKSNTTCSIDGGIWVRKSVFISNNDNIIVTQEFSGSNDALNFYDTRTCKKNYEIDISNSTWEIRGSEITISEQVTANTKGLAGLSRYHLDASCNLVKSLK